MLVGGNGCASGSARRATATRGSSTAPGTASTQRSSGPLAARARASMTCMYKPGHAQSVKIRDSGEKVSPINVFVQLASQFISCWMLFK